MTGAVAADAAITVSKIVVLMDRDWETGEAVLSLLTSLRIT